MKISQGRSIWAIAIFKFAKASLLLIAGLGISRLVHNGTTAALDQWVEGLGLNPEDRYIETILRRFVDLPQRRLEDIALGSFVYAALFLTEGIGLWTGKPWGKWVTVIITGSLIPLEIFEISRHPTSIKTLLAAVNIAVVVYLIRRLREDSPAFEYRS